jgi:serine/threonine-protein kinase
MSCLAKHPDGRPRTAWDLALAYEKALGRRLITSRAVSTVTPKTANIPGSNNAANHCPAKPTGQQATSTAQERQAIKHSIEATMPESMAMVKLKGFIFDLGGEVTESVPGLIKVRLIDRPPEGQKTSLLGWATGSARRSGTVPKLLLTDIELHMERRDPGQSNRLTITLVMRPTNGTATTEWRNRCSQISRDLSAYLMGR